MKMKALVLSLLMAGLAMAADATGKWTASVPGRDGATREVVYNLKADGDKLSGTTTGFGGQEVQISDGKIKGDSISFKTKVEFNGNSMTMSYDCTISGDEMKVKQTREGADQVREYTAKRSK